MKKKLAKILSLLLALLLFAFIAMGSGSDSETSKKDDDTNKTSTGETDDENNSGEKDDEPSAQTKFKVGETLVTKTLKVTFLSSGIYETDSEILGPKDGNKFVYIKLYCENTGSTDNNISCYDFECYADGYACEACYSMDDDLSATLSAGRTTTGTVCFEIPENASSVEFEFNPSIWSTTKYIFVYEGIKDSGISPSSDVKETSDAYKVGDIVNEKDKKITYLSCGEYESDNIFLQPKEGNKYIYIELEVENTGSSDINISYFNFECYADGASCEGYYVGDDELSATISAGRKAKGKIYFEVPEKAAIVEFEYSSSLLSSKKIVFSYSK